MKVVGSSIFKNFQLDFPTNLGLGIGESGFFRCDDRYAMAPVDDSKVFRKEVRIFCQRIFEPGSGVRIEYRLQTGAKIPPCEIDSETVSATILGSRVRIQLQLGRSFATLP